MKRLKDNQLVWRTKAWRCEECLFELCNRHSKLFYKIARRYFPAHLFSDSLAIENLIGSKESVVYECALAFKAHRKVKFTTWLGNFVRYKCLNYLNKNSRYINLEEEKLHYIFNSKSLEEHRPISDTENYDYVYNLLGQIKDVRIPKVFRLRYLSGEKKMTWGQIGEKMKISSQTAINLHNKGKSVLRRKMGSLSNADKII